MQDRYIFISRNESNISVYTLVFHIDLVVSTILLKFKWLPTTIIAIEVIRLIYRFYSRPDI